MLYPADHRETLTVTRHGCETTRTDSIYSTGNYILYLVITYNGKELEKYIQYHLYVDAFELWCWRRLLRISRTARRSNQSILKEINPEYPLERLMLKLKLQYCGHLMQRVNSLEMTLVPGKIEGKKNRG